MIFYNNDDDDYVDSRTANNDHNAKADRSKLVAAINTVALLFFIITFLPTGYYALLFFAGLYTPLFLVYSISAISILLILLILPFLTRKYRLHLKLILGLLIAMPVLAIISFIVAYNIYDVALGCLVYFSLTLPIACINLAVGVAFLPLAISWIRYVKSNNSKQATPPTQNNS